MAAEFSDGEAAVSAAALDLFGMPVAEARGPGRPGHVATAETRRFVNLLFVCGHPWLAIAKALGLKKTAFYEHYRAEIAEREFAALKFKGRQLERLNDAAEKGNVAAEKALAGMIQAEQLKQQHRAAAPAPTVKMPKLGKKDAAEKAAMEQRGMYEPPAAPLLLN